MTEREKAHRELEHALAALEERFSEFKAKHAIVGHITLRTQVTSITASLGERNAPARWALHNGDSGVCGAGYHRAWPRYLPALRKLAPVLLDIYCDAKGIE